MKTLPTQPATINAQNESPLVVQSDTVTSERDLQLTAPFKGDTKNRFIVARVNRYAASFDDKRDHANARLLANAYTAFDKAGRSLGVDAATLAESIDLAALVRSIRAIEEANTEEEPTARAMRLDRAISQVQRLPR